MSNSVPGKLPSQELRGRNYYGLGLCGRKTLELLIEEEESLVLADGATHGVAKLVAYVWVLRTGVGSGRRIEPVTCAADLVVAAKPVGVEVKGVGAPFGHNV